MPCERILHARRHLRKDLTVDKPIPFELSQMLRKHLLGCTRYQSLQFAKSVRPSLEVEQNHGFPFAADNFSSELNRTVKTIHKTLR